MSAAIRKLYLHAVPAPPREGLAAHHKLDRLRELRATIEALRQQESVQDPLVAWAIAQAQAHRDLPQSD